MSFLVKAYYYTWNIGFVEASSKNVVLSDASHVQVRWVKHNYKDRFFADPFILSYNDNTIMVLVEDFPYYDKKGMISLLTVDRKTYKLLDRKVVLNQPFHMSYPFILRKADGSVWVAPEASQSGSLFYYDMNEQTGMLENQRMLMDKPLLDSTIAEYNGKWWLFCTQRGLDSNRKLYIFYSEKPEGPWIAHTQNPAVNDDTMARPAGYLIQDGENLYRVIQKCDVSYGEAVNVSRITKLSTTEFEEVFVKELRAQKDEFSYGFHTLNGMGDLTVVDGIKKEFAPVRRIVYEIRNKLKK